MAFDLLDTFTISNQATLDIPVDLYAGIYGELLLELQQLMPATDDQGLGLRVSTDGGSTFDAGASAYRYARSQVDDSGSQTFSASSGTNNITLLANAGNDSFGGISGQLVLARGWDSVSAYTQVRFDLNWYHSSDRIARVIGAGVRAASQDTTDLRLFFGSGNLNSGIVKLIGVE